MNRGTISLVFDDGYRQIYEEIVPLLDKYTFPGVFAVCISGNQISQSTRRAITPWQTWLSLPDQNHEIASHTASHRDLTRLSATELQAELSESARLLSASTLVYPGGANNEQVVETATKYYSAARTVRKGFENIPPSDPYRLKTYNWSKHNWSLAKANLFALYATLTNKWLIETFHLIDDNEHELIHNVRRRDFERHLAFINKLPLQVKTIRDMTHSPN